MAEHHRLRQKKLQIWLLQEELEILQNRSASYGLSQSEYIRQLIFAERIIGRHWTMDTVQGKQLLYELNRIGNNINQIAYNTNAKAFATHTDWANLQKEYTYLLSLLGQIPFLDKDTLGKWQQQIDSFLRNS